VILFLVEDYQFCFLPNFSKKQSLAHFLTMIVNKDRQFITKNEKI